MSCATAHRYDGQQQVAARDAVDLQLQPGLPQACLTVLCERQADASPRA